ncbi:MAG: hypothetical protein ABI569_16875 [Casimicrobiaceae bacterium]
MLAGTLLCAPPARADDYTDIWWAGSAEDGWGVNFIQSQDFIFATFFVHGPAPAKTPIWYAGNLSRSTDGTNFSGGLFVTTGTGIGAPWNPADHSVTQVGTATFTPADATSGALVYTVNTGTQVITVTKSLIRQTLTPIAVGGQYYGTALVVHSGCKNSADNGTVLTDFDANITQSSGGGLQIDWLYVGSENCAFAGTYAQQGVLFRVPVASYVCTAGTTTTVNTTGTLYEMKATSIGFEGQWFVPDSGGGCSESGKFATVFP